MTEKGFLLQEIDNLKRRGYIPYPPIRPDTSVRDLRSALNMGKEELHRKEERLRATHIKNVLTSKLDSIAEGLNDRHLSNEIMAISAILDSMGVESVNRNVVERYPRNLLL